MADQTNGDAQSATALPERPKDAPEGEDKGPSKSALKKAAKDKEKVKLLSCNHCTAY